MKFALIALLATSVEAIRINQRIMKGQQNRPTPQKRAPGLMQIANATAENSTTNATSDW